MSAVWFCTRTGLRSQWRAWAVLAVLVGLMGGGVTAAAAGARRTDSAYARFLVATHAPQVLDYELEGSTFAVITKDQLSSLPEVSGAASLAFYGSDDPVDASLVAYPEETKGFLGRKMLAGRQPLPERADEVMVSFPMAERHHLHVGDNLPLSVVSNPDRSTPSLRFSFRVVGIEASTGEFPPQVGTGNNNVWATPAFFLAHVGDLKPYTVVAVRLRGGDRDTPALKGDIERLGGGKPSNLFVLDDQSVNTRHSIHLQALALWVLSGLLALAGALVTAQLLSRQTQLEAGDHAGLGALGMSRNQLWALGMVRSVVIGVSAAALAAVIAVLLSPLTPVGLARVAEPRPGPAVDGVVLGLAALGIVALMTVAGAWPAWRVAASPASQPSTPGGQARPSLVAAAAGRASAPVSLAAGVRLALEPGQGRTAVPVRSTLTGAAIGVVALTAALGFTASLNHLLSTPRLYGVTWDAAVSPGGSTGVGPAVPIVRDDPDVADVSLGQTGFPVTMGTVRADGIAVAPVQGPSLQPTPLEGRLPVAPDEVMLGRRTLAELHSHLGATVAATVADGPTPVNMKVVGVAVFPSLSDAMGLGKGVATTPEGLRHLVPGGDLPPDDAILVRFRPGVAAGRAIADLQHRLGSGQFVVQAPERPTDLVNFGQVQAFPLVLGGLLGAFAVLTLVNLLVTSIRRRRRDLAVLKTLGLTSGQVQVTVAWQSTTIALVAVLMGVPAGLAAARWVWVLFARQLGIVPEPASPLLVLGALGVATILVANMVAVLPGRVAARTSPALVLRSE